MRKNSRIFRACAAGALCFSAGTSIDRSPALPEVQKAIALQLVRGMLQDFYSCTMPKIEEVVGTGAFYLHPQIIRQVGTENGMPSEKGGRIRIETSQTDIIKHNIAMMVTEIDFTTGKISKYHWNYVGDMHEARHNKVVEGAVSCLNAHGPMV